LVFSKVTKLILRPFFFAVLAPLFLWAPGIAASQAWEMRVCADPNATPFSDIDRPGFENRIAAVLADELKADLTFFWIRARGMVDWFREAECDMILGVQDGQDSMIATLSYYRSPFVFIYRADSGLHIDSFDDPVLAELRLGIQPVGGPTHEALVSRGLSENITMQLDGRKLTADDPFAGVVQAVANNEVDVVVAWGPAPGYYAALDPSIVVTPIANLFDPPFIPMFINIAIGVRMGDESLRDRLNIAMANRWTEIQTIMGEFNIPILPLPVPTSTIGVR
jgi:ABC-type amino acid transport substrate-binding protein